MQQNPYCSRCLNSLTISQNNKGDSIGICDKCRTIKILSVKEKENYSYNEKCKKMCDCSEIAYAHGDNDFYECLCCFKKIPLSDDTLTHLKKIDLLRKLGELSQCGIKLSQNYSMKSNAVLMHYEYNIHKNERMKQIKIQWMKHHVDCIEKIISYVCNKTNDKPCIDSDSNKTNDKPCIDSDSNSYSDFDNDLNNNFDPEMNSLC